MKPQIHNSLIKRKRAKIDHRIQVRTPMNMSYEELLMELKKDDMKILGKKPDWEPTKMLLYEGQRSKVFGSVLMASMVKTGAIEFKNFFRL